MIITKSDKNEATAMVDIINFVNDMDADYISKESDEICKKQPFILSLILGYHHDFESSELEGITKILLVIWEYFKRKKQTENGTITEELYEGIHERNIKMLKYYEGETNLADKDAVISSDLNNMKSKALFTSVIFMFNTDKVLKRMKGSTKGIVIIGMKSLIECFEKVKKI